MEFESAQSLQIVAVIPCAHVQEVLVDYLQACALKHYHPVLPSGKSVDAVLPACEDILSDDRPEGWPWPKLDALAVGTRK